jgi:hypothetical protein
MVIGVFSGRCGICFEICQAHCARGCVQLDQCLGGGREVGRVECLVECRVICRVTCRIGCRAFALGGLDDRHRCSRLGGAGVLVCWRIFHDGCLLRPLQRWKSALLWVCVRTFFSRARGKVILARSGARAKTSQTNGIGHVLSRALKLFTYSLLTLRSTPLLACPAGATSPSPEQALSNDSLTSV